MQMRTFKGSDASAALARVKAELGEDAIILNTRTVREAGSKLCEITAAVDPRSAAPSLVNGRAKIPSGLPKWAAKVAQADATAGLDAMPCDWATEWRQIKDQLLALSKPQMDLAELAPRQRVAMQYLEREECDPQVLLGVYLTLRNDPGMPILPVLEEISPVRPFESKKWLERIHVFAGPAGSGKTSCLIRLALREKQARPRARVCVVAADQGQGKGRMVLRHYADLSGLAFREAATAEDMQDIIKEAKNFDMVLVDLPGLSSRATLAERLNDVGLFDHEDMAAHLVLSPYFSQAQYQDIARRYACPQLKSLIWTKLDEACSFGALLNVARLMGLPTSALSFGPGLKNTIMPAATDLMWRLFFKHQLPGLEPARQD